VLFLGDFWHGRGSLPVGLINSVLSAFRSWDVPTLMLVGNHDQTQLSGEQHALYLLAACRPEHVHVFSSPALWRSALWLPYRKEAATLEEAVRQAQAQPAPLRALFCHADVAGAQMNEQHQARDGLPPGLFPCDVPTYTGHYHLPHTVRGSRITYVGSPYQVSFSEAGQQKRLLLLDATSMTTTLTTRRTSAGSSRRPPVQYPPRSTHPIVAAVAVAAAVVAVV
jgi:DNA repair exonuclease SbcCD nuclease subunit